MKNKNQKDKNSSLINMQKNAKKAEAMLKVLANAKRLMILCHLVKTEKTVGELSKLVNLSQSALSQHLAKMRALNLVETDKKGQEVFYRIENQEVEAILSTLYLIYCK
jgi:ArsR family transcriptional regulator, virulence genes transcriptional regulator